MMSGKNPSWVLAGFFLIFFGLFTCVVAYLVVHDQVTNLDFQTIDVRGATINLTGLLTALSLICLLIGATGGYIIGKHRHS